LLVLGRHKNLYSFSGATSTLMLANSTKCISQLVVTSLLYNTLAWNDVVSASPHGACMAQWGDKMYIATGSAGSGGYVWSTTDTYATALTASGTNPHDWQTTPDAGQRKMPTAEHLNCPCQ
jgi:hypothetical protein